MASYGTQLSDGNPSGTGLGQDSSDLIGFHGKTATSLRSLPASLATGSTTAQGRAAINKIMNLLKTKGLGA